MGVGVWIETPGKEKDLIGTEVSPTEVRKALDNLGRDGWELVGVEVAGLLPSLPIRQNVYWLRRLLP